MSTKKPHSKSEARRLAVMAEAKTDNRIGKVFMAKDRARSFGLNTADRMTLAEVSTENGIEYFEFAEVKGTKWPSSLFYLA